VADPGTVSTLNSRGLGTIYGDLDPAYDDCSDSSHTSSSPVGVMTGQNISNLLNARHVTWGSLGGRGGGLELGQRLPWWPGRLAGCPARR
jgi:phospholipase C